MTRCLLPIVLALVLLGSTAPARAIDVDVLGPDGAALYLDGEPAGVLPLDGPLQLPRGEYVLEARLRGARTMTRPLTVGRRTSDPQTVVMRMTPLSRRTAVLSNLVVAGSGQRYANRPAFGWALTAAEAGGLLAALVGETGLSNHKSDYAVAQAEYAAAVTPDQIAAARAEVQRLSDAMSDDAGLRDAGLTLAVAAVAVSVLDMLLNFPGLEGGVDLDPVGPFDTAAGTGEPMLRVGMNLHF
ncbi:hypothetical protein KDK88_10110 [bacterium]|nr:hypothetical protein [bacterium]HPF35722.1 hypothetical protein [Candidatus Krumholzibacteria bacterium]HRX52207.1 hypothetical protein [Candidatus Krumholzibacteria bacterium]